MTVEERLARLEEIIERIDRESVILGPDGERYNLLNILHRHSDAVGAIPPIRDGASTSSAWVKRTGAI